MILNLSNLSDARKLILLEFFQRNEAENGNMYPIIGRISDTEFNRLIYLERFDNRSFDIRLSEDVEWNGVPYCIFENGGQRGEILELSVEIPHKLINVDALWGLRRKWLISKEKWEEVEIYANQEFGPLG